MKRRFRFSILLLALVLFASAHMVVAQGDASGTNAGNPTPVADTRNYKIGPGDILDISISKNPILSRTGVRVRNDGTIQLEMVTEDIAAACLTERQLADTITDKYRKYLVNPFANVAVKEFNASPVAVIGAVSAPGRFQLYRQYRLAELLSLVNGPAPTAGTNVEILRYGNIGTCDGTKLVVPTHPREELISIDLAEAFKGTESSNPVIQAGDIVRVSTADESNAYIQGLVKSSSPISLKEPVTLTQAIAMAGGPMPGAQMDKVLIRRPIPGSVNRADILVNVKDINRGRRDDVLLQRNDIVEIPGPSGAKKVFSEIFKTIIPSIARLPMSVAY